RRAHLRGGRAGVVVGVLGRQRALAGTAAGHLQPRLVAADRRGHGRTGPAAVAAGTAVGRLRARGRRVAAPAGHFQRPGAVRLGDRQCLLERGQPAPAAEPGRADDRVRDPVRAAVRLPLGMAPARRTGSGRHRLPARRRAVVRRIACAGRCARARRLAPPAPGRYTARPPIAPNRRMLHAQVHLTLPVWIHEAFDPAAAFATDEEKVALAIELSRRNVQARSGGPFGAVVFGPDHRVIAAGVNRVVPHTTSLAHAENMAYMLAQQKLQTPRLNDVLSPVTLATSSQPCCQCYGATIWAGIDRLLIGARAEDVMELTEFDEGPLPADWTGELERRGIAVARDILRGQAREVLRAYGESGGEKY